MHTFDDRFARQNRCGPPPEFPLASPLARKVHHLSGPTVRARSRTYSPEGIRPDCGAYRFTRHSHICFTLITHYELLSRSLARTHGRLLGPCFKTGRSRPFRQLSSSAAPFSLLSSGHTVSPTPFQPHTALSHTHLGVSHSLCMCWHCVSRNTARSGLAVLLSRLDGPGLVSILSPVLLTLHLQRARFYRPRRWLQGEPTLFAGPLLQAALAVSLSPGRHVDTMSQSPATCDTTRRSLLHWARSLPPGQVQALFTLFSESFSSFPHGTCSLSVSCRYSALDGVYHPPWVCIPKQTDSTARLPLLQGCTQQSGTMFPATGLSPSLAPSSKGLARTCHPPLLAALRLLHERLPDLTRSSRIVPIWGQSARLHSTTPDRPLLGLRLGFAAWALPTSLAVTTGILVSVSSSA